MRHQEVGGLIEHLFWVRDRILTASAELTDGEFQSRETVTTRDLRATLVHQLENEWAWGIRLSEGTFPAGDLLPTEYPTLDALVARWHREERDLRAWFDGLSDRDLAIAPPGDDSTQALWRYLLHVVNHGTQAVRGGRGAAHAPRALTLRDRLPRLLLEPGRPGTDFALRLTT